MNVNLAFVPQSSWIYTVQQTGAGTWPETVVLPLVETHYKRRLYIHYALATGSAPFAKVNVNVYLKGQKMSFFNFEFGGTSPNFEVRPVYGVVVANNYMPSNALVMWDGVQEVILPSFEIIAQADKIEAQVVSTNTTAPFRFFGIHSETLW